MAATLQQLKYRKRYYQEHKEQECAQNKQYRLDNQAKTMHIWAKRRARDKGLVFDITVEDIQNEIDNINGICPVFGIELRTSTKRMNPNSPSLDRIDSTRGYERDNICVISNRANILKRDASFEELQKLTRWMSHNMAEVI